MRNGLEWIQRRRKAAGLVALAVIWLPVLQVWWLAPRQAELAQRREALAERRAEAARRQAATAQVPAAAAAVAALEARGDLAASTGVAAGDSALLLRRVERLAREVGVRISAFEPQAEQVHERHSAWPTRLALSGSFPDLLRFFGALERCLPDAPVDELTLQVVEASETAAVRAAFTLTALGFESAAAGGDRPVDAACESAAAGGAARVAAAAADPFGPLPEAAEPADAVAARPPGLPGLRVSELVLQGLVQRGGQPLAVVVGPNGQSWVLRGGERLLDGAVAAVQADHVVFLEQDGGAVREVRRSLERAAGAR